MKRHRLRRYTWVIVLVVGLAFTASAVALDRGARQRAVERDLDLVGQALVETIHARLEDDRILLTRLAAAIEDGSDTFDMVTGAMDRAPGVSGAALVESVGGEIRTRATNGLEVSATLGLAALSTTRSEDAHGTVRLSGHRLALVGPVAQDRAILVVVDLDELAAAAIPPVVRSELSWAITAMGDASPVPSGPLVHREYLIFDGGLSFLFELEPLPGSSFRIRARMAPAILVAGVLLSSAAAWAAAELVRRRLRLFELERERRHLAERDRDWQRRILDHVRSAAIATDMDGRVMYWNRAAEDLYGWTADEAFGHPVLDLTVPLSGAAAAQEILAGIEATGSWEGDFAVHTKTGEVRHAHVVDSLIVSPDGSPIGVIGISHDVTEERRTRSALERRAGEQESLARLSHLALAESLDGVLDAVVGDVSATLAADSVELVEFGEELVWTTRASSGPSYDASDEGSNGAAIGAKAPSAIAPFDQDGSGPVRADTRTETISVPIANGHLWGALRVRRSGRGPIEADERTYLESVGNLVGTVLDRSDERSRRERLAAILDATPDFVGTARLDGTFESLNRAARSMLGLSSDGPVPPTLRIADAHPAHLHDLVHGLAIPTAIRDGHWQGELAILRPDGSELPVSQVIIAHRDGSGAPTHLSTIARDISDRIAWERELVRSRALVQEAFYDSPIGKAIVSVPDGRILSANSAAAGFLGRQVDELLSSTPMELTHPDDVSSDLHAARRIADGTIDGYEMEKRFVRPDGTVVWGDLHVSRLADPGAHGDVLVLAQIVDTTVRKEAERRLAFQASLLSQLPNAVIGTDLDANVIFWNRAAEELYGWMAHEVIGRNLFEMTVRDHDPDALASWLREILLSREVWEGEVDLVTRSGRVVPAWSTDALVRDGSGTPIGVVGVKIDLSERRRAERELQRLGELSRSVLDSVHFPIAVVDGEGRIVDVNRAWSVFTEKNDGDPATSGVGVSYLDVCDAAAVTDPAVAEIGSGIRSVLAGDADSYAYEYSCHAPGDERWFRMEVSPVSGIGAVIAHWDTTAERLARRSLEEIVEAKDRFLASVSHELRTPLTAVVGFAEHLRSGVDDPDERSVFHEMIADQAREVGDLVEDLLLLGRLDSETLVISPERVSIDDLVRSVVRPWTHETGDSIRVDIPADLTVRADPLRMRQILRNLVANAVRHGAAPIEIRATSDSGTVDVEVSDGGDGVPPYAVENLFDPYTSAAVRHGQPGSVGLGLHVSRRLAERMGGDLTYRREASRSVFALTVGA